MQGKCQSIGCTGKMNVGWLMLTGMIWVGCHRLLGHLRLRIGSMVSAPAQTQDCALKHQHLACNGAASFDSVESSGSGTKK